LHQALCMWCIGGCCRLFQCSFVKFYIFQHLKSFLETSMMSFYMFTDHLVHYWTQLLYLYQEFIQYYTKPLTYFPVAMQTRGSSGVWGSPWQLCVPVWAGLQCTAQAPEDHWGGPCGRQFLICLSFDGLSLALWFGILCSNFYTPTAHPTMNIFAPNGVHYPMNLVSLEYLYLSWNNVCDWHKNVTNNNNNDVKSTPALPWFYILSFCV